MALFLSFLWLNNIPSIHLLTDGKIQFEQRENKLQKNIYIMIQLIYNFESVTLNNKLFRNIYIYICNDKPKFRLLGRSEEYY